MADVTPATLQQKHPPSDGEFANISFAFVVFRVADRTHKAVNGRLVPVGQLASSEVFAWRELAQHAIEPNPVFEAACLVPAARHLLNVES